MYKLLRVFTLLCLAIIDALAAGTDNVVLQWNDGTLVAIRETRVTPPVAARALAMVHTAMFDAWAAYDEKAVGTRLGATLRRPVAERSPENKSKAASYAAVRVLTDLFPTQTDAFRKLSSSLGYDPNDTTRDANTAAGIGNVAAAAVIQFRHSDGSNQLGDLNPGAYSDYTGYQPVNTADTLSDPNRWQPLRSPTGQVQTFLAAHWERVKPFALRSAAQFRPGPAPLYRSELFRKRAQEALRTSRRLTDTEKLIAEFWEGGAGTETPPGLWQRMAQDVSRRDNHTLDQDVQMFLALSNAVLDVSIAVWETKRYYDTVRPISAVRYVFKDKLVKAWGGPGKGTQIIDGKDWIPYINTPPFSEYVSGHSTFSAASAEILKQFTGSDRFEMSVSFEPGSSRIEPGVVPKRQVTLSWVSFSDAADEAGMSRRYGGIHFEEGDIRGRIMGRQIGVLVWEKALMYINGTARQ